MKCIRAVLCESLPLTFRLLPQQRPFPDALEGFSASHHFLSRPSFLEGMCCERGVGPVLGAKKGRVVLFSCDLLEVHHRPSERRKDACADGLRSQKKHLFALSSETSCCSAHPQIKFSLVEMQTILLTAFSLLLVVSLMDAALPPPGLDRNLPEDYSDATLENFLGKAAAYKRSCIRRGGGCDAKPNDCCPNATCRCNLWGTNCRCERSGLLQQWGRRRK